MRQWLFLGMICASCSTMLMGAESPPPFVPPFEPIDIDPAGPTDPIPSTPPY